MNILTENETVFLYNHIRAAGIEGKTYCLYGTGKICIEILSLIKTEQLTAPLFITDHRIAHEKILNGFPIKPLEEAVASGVDMIILATNTYQDEMLSRLKKFPVSSDAILTFGHIRKYNIHTEKGEENEKILNFLYGVVENFGSYSFYGTDMELKRLCELLDFHGIKGPAHFIRKQSECELPCDIPVISYCDLPQTQQNGVIVCNFLEDNREIEKDSSECICLCAKDPDTYRMYAINILDFNKLPFVVNKALCLGITRRCNLKCLYCMHTQSEGLLPQLSVEEISQILQKAQGHVSRVNLSSEMGEPLMHNQLDEIIRMIVDMGLPVELITNGALMTRERAWQLAKSGLSHINFSMDSLDPEYNRKIRGIDTEKILSMIEYISKYIGLDISINSVVTGGNLDLIGKLPLLKKRVPTLRKLILQPIAPTSKLGMERVRHLRAFNSDYLRKRLDEVREVCEKVGILCAYTGDFSLIHRTNRRRVCSRPWTSIYVNAEGKLITCCTACIDPGGTVENILGPATLQDAFNHPRMMKLRRCAMESSIRHVCKTCPYAT